MRRIFVLGFWSGDEDIAAVLSAAERARVKRQPRLIGTVFNVNILGLNFKYITNSIKITLSIIVNDNFVAVLQTINVIKW